MQFEFDKCDLTKPLLIGDHLILLTTPQVYRFSLPNPAVTNAVVSRHCFGYKGVYIPYKGYQLSLIAIVKKHLFNSLGKHIFLCFIKVNLLTGFP